MHVDLSLWYTYHIYRYVIGVINLIPVVTINEMKLIIKHGKPKGLCQYFDAPSFCWYYAFAYIPDQNLCEPSLNTIPQTVHTNEQNTDETQGWRMDVWMHSLDERYRGDAKDPMLGLGLEENIYRLRLLHPITRSSCFALSTHLASLWRSDRDLSSRVHGFEMCFCLDVPGCEVCLVFFKVFQHLPLVSLHGSDAFWFWMFEITFMWCCVALYGHHLICQPSHTFKLNKMPVAGFYISSEKMLFVVFVSHDVSCTQFC